MKTSPETTEQQVIFSDESHVRKVVRACHDILFKDEGLDPANAYDYLLTLLILKVFDERHSDSPRFRTAHASQDAENPPYAETANRLKLLRDEALNSEDFRELLNTEGTNHADPTSLDEVTLHRLVSKLERFNLTETYSDSSAPDIKGEMFQELVGETFRGELGAYFTPRQIVDFMVRFLEIDRDMSVLDPACGSGGFFLGVLRHLRDGMGSGGQDSSDFDIHSYVDKNIWGCDINSRMGRTARFNLLTFSGSTGNITIQDALQLQQDHPLNDTSFDIVLSNPPFAGNETRRRVLERYEIAQKPDGSTRTVSKELPFIERILGWLNEGGRAGLVLPESVLNLQSSQFKDIRSIITDRSRILGIVRLPKEAFFHTDTGVQGVLLFLERTDSAPDDYEVFIDWADDVGYNTLGHRIGRNDLPAILNRYRNRDTDPNRWIPLEDLQQADRFDPAYHKRGHSQLERRDHGGEHVRPLSELVDCDGRSVPRSVLNEHGAQVAYVQVGNCDKEEGSIADWRDIVVGQDSVPSRLSYWLEPNTILIPNHRDSIKSGRNPVLVPETFDAKINADGTITLLGQQLPNVHAKFVDDVNQEKGLPGKVLKGEAFPIDATYDINRNELSITHQGVSVVLPNHFLGFVTTNRFMVLRPQAGVAESTQNALLRYLSRVLRLDEVKEQEIRATTGAASPELKEGDLQSVRVPLPADESIDSFVEDLQMLLDKIDYHESAANELRDQVATRLKQLVPSETDIE